MEQVTQPTNVKAYKNNETVDIVLSYMGKAIVPGSVQLEGNVRFYYNNGNIDLTKNIHYDPTLGIHGLIQGFTVTSDKQGVIDNHSTEYPRSVKAKRIASVERMEFSANTRYTPELTAHDEKLTKYIMKGDIGSNSLVPFNMYPEISINNAIRTSSNPPIISYSKFGNLRISFRIALPEQSIYGNDANGITFQFEDIRVRYRVVDDNPKAGPVTMRVSQILRNTINSNNKTLSVRVPIVAQNVILMTQQQSRLNNYLYNNWLFNRIAGIDSIEFAYNDSLQQYQTYRIETHEEMLLNFIRSYTNNTNVNGLDVMKLYKDGSNFAIGTGPLPNVNFQNQKFSINVISDANSVDPYTTFLLFNGIIQL